MLKKTHKKDNAGIAEHLSLKFGDTTKNKFLRYAVPVIGGMIIGLLSAFVMKLMGKLSF